MIAQITINDNRKEMIKNDKNKEMIVMIGKEMITNDKKKEMNDLLIQRKYIKLF